MPCGECDHFYDHFCGIECEQYIGKCCDLSYCNNGAEPLHACCTFFDDHVCDTTAALTIECEEKPVVVKPAKKPVKPIEVEETEPEDCEEELYADAVDEDEFKFNSTGTLANE